MTELWRFFHGGDLENTYSNLIIMTHNIHFYLNIILGTNGQKDYKKNPHFHLIRTTSGIRYKHIENEKGDFKTSYSQLWHELKFLFDNDQADFMINPARRILETFINFNGFSKTKFYENNKEAKKMFNVHSHGIEDFSADLNNKTKDEIITMLKAVFESNNHLDHFNKHWNEDRT